MSPGIVRLFAVAAVAGLLFAPLSTAPALAQSQAQMAAAMKDAAKKATRDFEAAIENAMPIEAPAWDGQGPAPIDVFIARPQLSSVVMSPDGKNVAAMRRDKGVSYLMLVSLDGAGSKALPLPGMSISAIMWGANDRILYMAGADRIKYEGSDRGMVMVGAPRLYSIGLDMKNPMMFFENDKRLSQENLGVRMLNTRIHGDPRHVLMAMKIHFKLDLLKVDVYTGEWEIVGQGEDRTFSWFTDSTGRPVIRFDSSGSRGTQIDVMLRQGTGGGVKGNWRKVQSIRRDPEQINTPDFDPVSPGPKPNQYYVRARSADNGTIGVYLYDVDTGAMVQTMFHKDTADAETPLFDRETGAYVGTVYWEERLKYDFIDPAMTALMAGLDEGFGKAFNLTPVSRSADNKRWLVHAGSATSPGAYYLYDLDAKAASEIGVIQPVMAKVRPARVAPLQYTARDGLKVNAYLTLPPGWNDKSGKLPLIVMPHGGPELRDYYEYSPTVQFLASRGYAVFQPNFRGSAGYGKAFQDAGRGHWGDAMQDDIDDGVKMLVDGGVADPARMCIFGASYGGYASMMTIVRYPDKYKCAVSASGPTDLNKQLAFERKGEGTDSPSYIYWTAQIGDPGKDKAQVDGASPTLQAAQIKVPVLLLHGKRDNTVPYEQSEIMRDALKKASKPAEMVTFETAGHGFSGQDMKRFLGELEAFLGKNLGVTPVPLLP